MKSAKTIQTLNRRAVLVLLVMTVFLCTACGAGKGKESSDKLEGSLSDIMAALYDNAELSEDFREGMGNLETLELSEDLEVTFLGTDEIDYTEGIISVPMMSSIAYQCVLLRVAEDDVETVKQQIKENTDLNKWVCVSAETMLIESRGDVVFFVMGDNDTAYALNAAFQDY